MKNCGVPDSEELSRFGQMRSPCVFVKSSAIFDESDFLNVDFEFCL